MNFKLLHKNYISILFIIIFCNTQLLGQRDTIQLGETEISAAYIPKVYNETSRQIQIITKVEIEKSGVQSLQQLLEYATNADIRQRGGYGVQADISIRGGSFDQTLILLNGVKVNDPQTGHHNMDLAVDLQDIERIEILQGPGARIYGANAFSGVINIITISNKENSLKFSTTGGEHNLFSLATALSIKTKKTRHYFSFSKKVSDGYIKNTDFNILNLFYQGSLQSKKTTLDVQTGYNLKKFGANSFYSAKYPNQFEQTETFFVNANCKIPKLSNLGVNLYYRLHKDRFELFRSNPPSWYKTHNYHLTQTYGVESKLQFNSCLGKTALGAEFRIESIKSNVLGEPMQAVEKIPDEPGNFYTKSHQRENISLFAEQAFQYKKINISGGLLVNRNSDFETNINAGIDGSYDISENWKYYASVNQSMRMPTFTDLYYVGPTNKGNINLKPEEAITYETGFKYHTNALNAHLSVFRRDANNLIDWLKLPDSTKWESRNLTQIITHGFEFSTQLNMQNIVYQGFLINSVQFSYSFLDLGKNSNNYISYYALDYLKHKFVAGIEHKIYKRFSANWLLCYRNRMGTYTDIVSGMETNYPAFATLDIRVNYRTANWNCFVEASNVFNKKYQDFGNIQMPGRWIMAGINIKLNLGKKAEKKGNDIIEIIK
jgi:iron complex outermembrane receptor protein